AQVTTQAPGSQDIGSADAPSHRQFDDFDALDPGEGFDEGRFSAVGGIYDGHFVRRRDARPHQVNDYLAGSPAGRLEHMADTHGASDPPRASLAALSSGGRWGRMSANPRSHTPRVASSRLWTTRRRPNSL